MAIKSQQELYDLFITELQSQAPALTDENEGSINDVLAGVTSVAVDELQATVVDEFAKTFFETAHGPEVTGGPDDLERLAVDHFGLPFARPAATKAVGVVTFARPTAAAGDCVIPAGTIVKTEPNANGEAQRYQTVAEVTLVALTINASVEALVAGTEGNATANKVTKLESTLTDDTVTVNNALAFAGGEAEQNDADYRETIRQRLTSLTGATIAAIQAGALSVAGVETATALEAEIVVIECDPSTGIKLVGKTPFRIPRVRLYIADANGTADQALMDAVAAAIADIRAAGVRIDIAAATALLIDWTATITLNPAGPNYGTLASDPTMIEDSMRDYIRELPIGTGFTIATANAAILAIWGPSGSDDISAFTTSVPSGNIPATAEEKLIPDVVQVA